MIAPLGGPGSCRTVASHRGGGGHWPSGRGSGGSQGASFSSAGHNPFEVKIPKFLDWPEVNTENETENSIIMVDDRDWRVVSPFQLWLTKEIMSRPAMSQMRSEILPGSIAGTPARRQQSLLACSRLRFLRKGSMRPQPRSRNSISRLNRPQDQGPGSAPVSLGPSAASQ